jgi:hypothetical protein
MLSAEADPCGMTIRKARTTAKARLSGDASAEISLVPDHGFEAVEGGETVLLV